MMILLCQVRWLAQKLSTVVHSRYWQMLQCWCKEGRLLPLTAWLPLVMIAREACMIPMAWTAPRKSNVLERMSQPETQILHFLFCWIYVKKVSINVTAHVHWFQRECWKKTKIEPLFINTFCCIQPVFHMKQRGRIRMIVNWRGNSEGMVVL